MSEQTIQLLQSDPCFERARKILEGAGVANDPANLAARMAEAIEAYRKMDLDAGEDEPVEVLIERCESPRYFDGFNEAGPRWTSVIEFQKVNSIGELASMLNKLNGPGLGVKATIYPQG